MKRLLVTGASGFLGGNVCRLAGQNHSVYGLFNSNPVTIANVKTLKLDLTDYKALKEFIFNIKPQCIIHTAALAVPGICQNHPGASFRINVQAAQNIAGLCADLKIPCVFTSTDLVFDGRNPPYVETDPVSPVCTYAEHKVLAETGMAARYPQTVICRMSLMFGQSAAAATSFLQPTLAAMRRGQRLNLFVDEYRTPLDATSAAAGLMLALGHTSEIIHLGGDTRISRYDLGKLIAKRFEIASPAIAPCKSTDIPTATPRSADVTLTNHKAKALGFQPTPLDKALLALKKAGL